MAGEDKGGIITKPMAYTAKVVRKEETTRGLRVFVEFANAGKTHEEDVIPATKSDFEAWLSQRLRTLNESLLLKDSLVDGAVISPKEPEPEPVKTQAELDREAWLANYSKWVRIKLNLVDTNILTGNETALVALLNKIKTDFKPDYLNFI